MKASWNGQILAESDETIVIENNHYFPPTSVDMQYFTVSNTTTRCAWKGTAGYYNVVVDGEENKDAAWYYPDPLEATAEIKGYVAFWKGVDVSA